MSDFIRTIFSFRYEAGYHKKSTFDKIVLNLLCPIVGTAAYIFGWIYGWSQIMYDAIRVKFGGH